MNNKNIYDMLLNAYTKDLHTSIQLKGSSARFLSDIDEQISENFVIPIK